MFEPPETIKIPKDIPFEPYSGAFFWQKWVSDSSSIRDREKVMRGLKVENTPILKGYQIYHNFVRPHQALNGKTPADLAGIKVHGENKWLTLIQNASKHEADFIEGVPT